MSRKMTPAQITAAHTRLSRTGKSLGIGFKFGGSIGSSRLAHRVLYLAGEQDGSGETQSRVSVALFKRQFELELDVSELEVVVAAAVEGGLEEVAVRGFLERGGGVKEVEDEAKRVRERGVRGVPQFFFAGEHSFEGAGDIEEFFEAFVKARG
ncbi:DSBA-like thioredoxin domain-containing protein [Aspergillus crustosus]